MVAIFTGLGAGFERGSRAALGSAGLLGSGVQGRAGDNISLNAATGNLVITQQDEFLAGLGPDIAIGRTYNSSGALNENSDGWRQSTDRRVYNLTGTVNTSGSTITRVSADGSEIVYTYSATLGAYTTTDGAGAYDKLSYSGGDWTWTDGSSQFTETYLAADGGYISKFSDTDGNALSFTYVSAGKLDRVTTQNGEYVQYAWSGNDITAIVTHFGASSTITRTAYGYDGQHRLTTVTVDLTPDNTSDSSTYTTTYAYVGTTNLLASITQSDGSSLAVSYDGSSRVTDLVQLAGSGDTRTTHIDYVSSTQTNVTDPRGQVTSLYYNASGQLTQVTAPPAYSGATAQTVQYAYDTNGNLTSVTDPTSAVTTYTYDANGNVATVTDANNNVVTRSYDAKNALILETRTASTAASNATSLYTRYVYDAEDHLRFVISAEGRVTEYRYDASGNLQYTIDYPDSAFAIGSTAQTEAQMQTWVSGLSDRSNTEICKYVYDARGNLTQSTHYGAASSAGVEATSEGYAQTVYAYDQAGHLMQRTLGPLSTESFVYDGLGRLTASTDLNGGATTIAFNDAATTTTILTAAGLTTVSTYNKAGDLVTSQVSGTNTTGGTENFVYDKNGELRKSTDATNKAHYFLYNKVGRKVADISQNGEVVEYRYDQDGRLIATVRYANTLSTTDLNALASNALTEFDMDATHRPGASTNDVWSWTIYDAGGRIVETIAGDGAATKYEYDNSDRLVKTTSFVNRLSVSSLITTPPTTAAYPTSNANDAVTRSFYDGDGRLIGALNAQGFVSRIIYDSAGRKVQTVAYSNAPTGTPTTDAFSTILGNITTDATKDISTRFVYDDQGFLRFTIDALNHVAELVYRQNDDSYAIGVVRKTIQYATALGSVANYSYATIKAAVAAIASSANDRVSYAVYNTHGQLAYAIDATRAMTAFAYDIAGRVIKTTQYATPMGASDADAPWTSGNTDSVWLSKLTHWISLNTSAANDRVTRTWYAERGEVRYVVDAEGYLTQNDYDAEGRLVGQHRWSSVQSVSDATTIANLDSASKGTDAAIAYHYDIMGRVDDITDQLGAHTTRTYYANGLLQDEIQASGSGRDESKTRRTYDQAGNLITVTTAYGATEAATTTYAYDGQGNISSITDARGNATAFTYDKLGRVLTQTEPLSKVTTYQYDAFGNVVKTTDARSNSSFAYYDQANRLVLSVDAEKYATRTAYTVFSEVQSVTRYVTAVGGAIVVGTQPSITTNAADETTNFAYDKLSRLVQTTDAAGGVEDYGLNAFGQRISFTNKGNGTARATINYSYDRRGLLTSETLPIVAIRADGTTEATSVTNIYAYDSRGNRTQMVEASGLTEQRTTTYAYDLADRLVSTSGDAVQATSSAISGTASVTPTTSYVYDLRGNVIQTTAPNGAKTFSWYDKLDRVVEQVSPLGTVTTFIYDANGNVTEKRVYATLITPPADASGSAPSASGTYRSTQYTYDALNRVTQVKTPSIEVASYTTSLGVTTQDLITATQYDAMGNVVKVTDANGNVTWSYYDKLGRKTTQIDALNYRTDWTYDADGNVLSEKRYANAGTTPTGVTTPPSAPTADATNDRTTTFTYDKMGRRLTETRANVVVHNAASPGTTVTVNSTVTYTYNALGEVATKTEAAGDATAYAYDSSGRMTSETHASFTGYTTSGSHSVTPVTSYSYDGLNDLVRTVQTGDSAASAADRVTQYAYGAGGRLASVTDAEAFVHTYRYDAAGRVTRDEYFRQLPNGTTSHEAAATDYDLEGRVIRQGVLVDLDTSSTDTWSRAGTAIDTNSIKYNAFGEVSQRGMIHYSTVDNSVTSELYPETFEYDGAGRLWRTTSGDGTTKYFMYDAAGNQTLMVASTGTDISAGAGYSTIDSVLALWTGGVSTIGTTFVSGIVATITRYDARNQAIEVKEPQRELTTTTKSNLSTTRAYNAFGEVAYEINALSARVDYTYNAMGRLIQTQSPTVSITSAAGAVSNVRPTENYYYDASGRRVAARDANANLTQYTLLAGSGYNGKDALIAQTKFADNNTITTSFDIFGDARKITDQISRIDTQSFDKMGRLTQLNHASGLIDYYRYDGVGQRIRTFNSFFNPSYNVSTDPTGAAASNAQTITYDAQGRITQSLAMGGDTTNYAYAWDATIVTSGMGTFGGWTQTTTYANYKTAIEKLDYFERSVQKTDMGGNVSVSTYDKAGRLFWRSGGDALAYFHYYNTGRVSEAAQSGGGQDAHFGGLGGGGVDSFDYRGTTYTYDAVGNVLTQVLRETGTYQGDGFYDSEGMWEVPDPVDFDRILTSQTATYDALGRLATWSDAGSGTGMHFLKIAPASHSFQYDANGNIRRSLANYRALDSNGVAAGTATTQDYWYKYDSLNRMTTADGSLSGGVISRGTTGVDIVYDAAGQRQYTIAMVSGTAKREDYTYDNAGRVLSVKSGTSLTAPGTLRGAYTYDLMGRLLTQNDYATNGTSVVFSRANTYNAKGQITYEVDNTVRSGTTYRAESTFDLGVIGTNAATSTYALGTPLTVTTVNYENNVQKKTTLTTYGLIWADGAQTDWVQFKPDITLSGYNYTDYIYATVGGVSQLVEADITDGRPRTVWYHTDNSGQVITRDEMDALSGGDPHEVWYRFVGKQLGYVGNNGTIDTDYATSVNNRTATQGTGAFQNGATAGTSSADFDLAYDSISSYDQGSTSGMYTVQSGDTLSSIAAQLWGDSSLWYKLAEVNGLVGDETLVDGLPLIIPAGVTRNTNSAATFKPYDPNDVTGSTMPTAIKPKVKGDNCGAMLLIAVLCIAITVIMAPGVVGGLSSLMNGGGFLAGFGAGMGSSSLTGAALAGAKVGLVASGVTASAGASTVAIVGGAAAAGAAGSIVSQGVAVASQIQSKFSWNAVALSAIGSGVGAGLGLSSTLQGMPVTRAMLGSALTQGIGVATGLQGNFSWAAVGAAGISAMTADFVGGQLANTKLDSVSQSILTTSASDIADAASRSLIDGSDFGDNMLQALPDIMGQMLGNAVNTRSAAVGKELKTGPATDKQVLDAATACQATAGAETDDGLTPAQRLLARVEDLQARLALLDELGSELGQDANVMRLAAADDAERAYNDVSDYAWQTDGLLGQGEAVLGEGIGIGIGALDGTVDAIGGLADGIIHLDRTAGDLVAFGQRASDYLAHTPIGDIPSDAYAHMRMLNAAMDLEQARIYLTEGPTAAGYFAGHQAGEVVGSFVGPAKIAEVLVAARAARAAAATGTPRSAAWVARAAGEFMGALPRLLQNAALRSSVVGILRGNGTYKWSEALGLLHSAREGERLGYAFREILTYGPNNGIDAVFSRVAGNTTVYAVWSAKGGMEARSMSALGGTRYGTELSDAWLERTFDRVEALNPNTPKAALAATLRAEYQAGRLERYASFRASDRTYEVLANGATRVSGTIR